MNTKVHFEPQEQGQLPVAMDAASYPTGIQEVGDLVDHSGLYTGPEDFGQAARPQDLGQANMMEEAEHLFEDFGELNRKFIALRKYKEEIENQLVYEQKKTAALTWENVELKQKLGKSEGERNLYDDLLKRNTFLKSEIDELKKINGKSRCEIGLQEERIKELECAGRQGTYRAEEEHKLALGFKKQSQGYKEQLDACSALYDLQQQKLNGMAKQIEKLTREGHLLRPPARVLPEDPSVQENRRFRIEQVNDHLRCTRCHNSPGEEDDTCYFHPITRCPYPVWKYWFPQEVGLGTEFFFWPCCQKFGIKEPTGCQTMDEHQI
ncbi:uncharacterized protein LOC110461522 [Mizuhopecten yessoensis]|uniref:Uncharacterized protein n=1 Tax=Mizuhopecten yessoensis TaxID=6573 RepID=A0A210Q0C5_MIZYE|nr:uncharacterized protein LOC110461522 [Mizuhopecten yessoensis]XP_021370684.1 uncharacterized protein LOC110461522 [Mizuhopecten yessoensis]XP_021370685.1 uncharacterized protein LOC110461522 [Mizuhopecten yessoensis]OWF42109.1 hypothetical protein KP79_PYT09156 [Mizuhopecten yessoensis]